ncbi:MAG: M56 family metallopeptidase [Candidatus Sulfotelmatobacter sp.]
MSATFSSLWTSIVSPLADHLWQSSLFALAAALLTLTLRKDHARARYWLWLAASVKFLVPFTWLISFGSSFSWLNAAPANADSYLSVEQISQPFTQHGFEAIATPAASSNFLHLLPALLALGWFAGFMVVLITWFTRWRQISAQITNAIPLHEGREVEALQRVQHSSGIRKQIRMLLSKTMLEPGIFGLLTPVLVWPKGITERLDNAHLEAILAHELWHVRRRDNLAAAVHMMVEAIFWFHPLVWWLGARMVDERERACDEEVLELGGERQIYAESILKVCEFCVGSQLACVAGVTGADLKKRMVHIMSEHVVRKLNFGKKLLLTAVAVAAIAAPVVFGLLHPTPVRAQSASAAAATSTTAYGTVSITPSQEAPTPTYAGEKTHMVRMMMAPNKFDAVNVTLRAVIQEAYGVQANQITGGPDWLDTAAYDIQARTNRSAGQKVIVDDRKIENQHMLQAMLADRAKLVWHHDTANLPSYALVVSENGPKLQPAQLTGDQKFKVPARDATITTDRDEKIAAEHKEMSAHRMLMQMDAANEVVALQANGTSMDEIAQQLARQLGTVVVNKTGLQGLYDFNLQWKSDGSHASQESGADSSSNQSLLTAVEEQLGLKLEPQNAPTEVLVIDHIERPTEN